MALMDGRLELTDLAVLLSRQGMPRGQLLILRTSAKRLGSSSTPGSLVKGNAKAGTFNNNSAIFTMVNSRDSVAGAAKYGDNMITMSSGPEGCSLASPFGTAASAGKGNIGVASAKMITNSLELPEPGSSGSSNALIGQSFFTMDFRSLTLGEGVRMSGIRNGTEAFAVIGSSRAYKNGNDVVAVSSGTGYAGVSGNKVWVNDSQYGSASAELCDCTTKRRGMWCYCECHGGTSRKH